MTRLGAGGVARSVKALALCVLVLFGASLAATVEAGHACSCAVPDPRTALAQADAAFVGTLRSRQPVASGSILVFSVEKSLKGGLGSTVEVSTDHGGGGCGIASPVGTRVGLVLQRIDGRWYGSICTNFAPEELLAAALPLPRPNGSGPVALLVGGRFGPEMGMLALDRRGRTLAYGRNTQTVGLLSPCPGGRRVAEISHAQVNPLKSLVIRNARTLRVIRRQRLQLPEPREASELLCEDAQGSSVLLFAGRSDDSTKGRAIYRLAGRRLTTIWKGDAVGAALGSTVAYVSAGMKGVRLLAVSPRTGRVTRVARLPGSLDFLSPSKSGTHIAAVDYNPRGSQLVVVDLRRRPAKVRSRPLEGYGELAWLSGERFVLLPADGGVSGRVLDLKLRTRSRFHWRAHHGALVGSTAFGIDFTGRLVSTQLPSGSMRVVRRLPGVAHVIVPATR